jgi:hypothetical protein
MTVQSPDSDERNGNEDGGAGSMNGDGSVGSIKADCADAASGNQSVAISAAQPPRMASMKTHARLNTNAFG